MIVLTTAQVRRYRERTFRLTPDRRLHSKEEAIAFVRERGFVYFWPIKGIVFPSLWTAVAGERPVASAHDDPGHVTWGWKDELLDKRVWYYGKVLRGKATMITLDVVPYFYALSQNYGEPDEDYLDLYREGRLTQAGKAIYEALLREGPLDTVTLRRVLQMTSKTSNSPFERGMTELQRDFKILPVGVSRAGAWRYSFKYDLVHRYYPQIPEQARGISPKAARERLAALYFESVGSAPAGDLQKLMGWSAPEVKATLTALVETGSLRDARLDEKGDALVFATSELDGGC